MGKSKTAGRQHIPDFPSAPPSGVNWLLVIAIDAYEHCAPLQNCVSDAQDVIKELTTKYNFEKVIELPNEKATYENILEKLEELSKQIKKDVDNLVLYFSGHGDTEGDAENQIGYLVPVDARKGKVRDYIPHSFFKEKLNLIPTRHTFVIIDACFSGSFFSNIRGNTDGAEHLPSRWGISSTKSREVALDGTPGDNSPFAKCLIETLQENAERLGPHRLAANIEQKMEVRGVSQKPTCKPFLDHKKYNDGMFFFHPAKNEAQEWTTTEATDTAAAYLAFWQKYPDHPNAEEALWRYACKQNEVHAFQLYRNTFYGGKYFEAALDKIDDVVFEQAKGKGIDQLRDYLKRFGYTANHAKEAHQLIDNLLSGINMGANSADSTPSADIPIPEPQIITPKEEKQIIAPHIRTNEVEPEMVLVQGGKLKRESGPEVTLKDFYIGKYPVTQAEWRAVMGSDPPELKFKGCDQCPVENVSWNDVQDFIKTLNQKTGKSYRLPSEAEWEYAARGGVHSLPLGEGRGGAGFTYAGSNNLDEVGWYDKNSDDKTHPVGQKKANELGIYDMSGNVWEWCEDVWHDNYNGAPTDGSAWLSGGDQNLRVLRGGSWSYIDSNCRVAIRYGVLSEHSVQP